MKIFQATVVTLYYTRLCDMIELYVNCVYIWLTCNCLAISQLSIHLPPLGGGVFS